MDHHHQQSSSSSRSSGSVVSRDAFVRQMAAALQERFECHDEEYDADDANDANDDGNGRRPTPTARTQTQTQSSSSASSSRHDDRPEAMLELWRQLHFDQPQCNTSAFATATTCCAKLSEALLRPSRVPVPVPVPPPVPVPVPKHQPKQHNHPQQPSLTPRFVRGLQQALQQQQQQQQQQRQKPSDADLDGAAAKDSDVAPTTAAASWSLLRPEEDLSSTGLATTTTTTGSSGLAQLAWTVHGKIPLHILAYQSPAVPLLGTFRGPPVATVETTARANGVGVAAADDGHHHHQQHDRDRDRDDSAVDAVVNAWSSSSSSSQLQVGGNDHGDGMRNDDDRGLLSVDDDDDEVWADESDPSDYSYGNAAVDRVDAVTTGWFDAIDDQEEGGVSNNPHTPPFTARVAAEALTALIDHLQYRDVAALRPWTTKIDDELTQLALTLLLMPTSTTTPTSADDEADTSDPHPPAALDASAILRSLPARHWQQLALRPIHVLRDAAAAASSSSVEEGTEGRIDAPSRRNAYLQLLQSMLQVHRIFGPPSTAPAAANRSLPAPNLPPTSSTIPPATWLALALLADECDACRTTLMRPGGSAALLRLPQQRRLEAVQGIIVGSVDDVVLILEGAAAESDAHNRLQVSHTTSIAAEEAGQERVLDDAVALLVPIFRVLCWPHVFTGTYTVDGAFPGLFTASNPSQSFQMLLNSGLYRQLLLSWQQLKREDCALDPTDAPPDQDQELSPLQSLSPSRARRGGTPLLRQMETAVLELSVASPKLLGKYAWRFPGMAASLVQLPSLGDTEWSMQQAVEWSLLGMVLSTAERAATVVHWKARPGSATSTTAGPPPTYSACQATARTGIQLALQRLVRLVDHWKKQRMEGAVVPDASTGSSREPSSQRELQQEQRKHQQWLAEFQELVERLTHWPLLTHSLRQLERSSIEGSDKRFSMRDALQPLQKALSTWPSRRASQSNVCHNVSGESQSKKWDDLAAGETGSIISDALPVVPASPASPDAPPDDDDGAVVPLWKQGAQDAAVDALRRSVKTLASLCDDFDAADAMGAVVGNHSTTVSSKAD